MAFRKKSEIKRIGEIVYRSFESLGEMHKINKFEIIPKWFCSASGITISYYNMLHIYPTPCACTCCLSYKTPYEYSNFFNKVAGLQLATLQKKGTHRNCFGYWLLKWIGKREKKINYKLWRHEHNILFPSDKRQKPTNCMHIIGTKYFWSMLSFYQLAKLINKNQWANKCN